MTQRYEPNNQGTLQKFDTGSPISFYSSAVVKFIQIKTLSFWEMFYNKGTCIILANVSIDSEIDMWPSLWVYSYI